MLQKLEVPREWLWFWHADVPDKVQRRNYVQGEGNSPHLNIFRTQEGAIPGKSMTGCYFSILLWSGLFSHQNSGLLCKIVSWGIFLYAKPSLHCNSTERNEQSSFPMQFWAARRTEFKAQRERIDRSVMISSHSCCAAFPRRKKTAIHQWPDLELLLLVHA